MALALVALVYSLMNLTEVRQVPVYRMIAIVDITRSMNAEDYELDGKSVSRLEYVKHSLRELLLKLPCQSKLGLGIFTDRRSSLLLEAIDVCAGFNELDKAINALDWRMAWAADSRIANGLLSTLEMLQGRDETILFLTDGQEAPPMNPVYRPDFSAIKGKAKGIIIGVGSDKAVPIPKFNNRGKRIGVYQPDDVPNRSTFGVSDLNPEHIEGYDTRNAPFGSPEAVVNEHLSSIHESYLQEISTQSGLTYHRLANVTGLNDFIQEQSETAQALKEVDVRWRYVTLALIMLILAWL